VQSRRAQGARLGLEDSHAQDDGSRHRCEQGRALVRARPASPMRSRRLGGRRQRVPRRRCLP
jgi:hypothetical protein